MKVIIHEGPVEAVADEFEKRREIVRQKQPFPRGIDHQCARCDSSWADITEDDGSYVRLACTLCGLISGLRIRLLRAEQEPGGVLTRPFPSGRCAGKTVDEAMETEEGREYVGWYVTKGSDLELRTACQAATEVEP